MVQGRRGNGERIEWTIYMQRCPLWVVTIIINGVA